MIKLVVIKNNLTRIRSHTNQHSSGKHGINTSNGHSSSNDSHGS